MVESNISSSAVSEPKVFRLNAFGFFLTWPQCPITKEEAAKQLQHKTPVEKGVIAEEKHEDGQPHLHAYLKYSKKLNISNAAYFDLTSEDGIKYHGNYQTAKCSAAVTKYCTKDGNYLEIGNMNIKQEIQARQSNKKILGKRLCDGESLVNLVDEFPELLFNYRQIQANIKAYQEDKARAKPTCEDYIPNTWQLELPLLDCKKKHYWFWSDKPDYGKTTFLKELDRQFRCSWFTVSEIYQSINLDSQFVLIDEFSTAHVKATVINAMCDGTYQYPVKGGAARPVPAYVIITGNKHPADIYPNAWQYIQARFTVYRLDPGPNEPTPASLVVKPGYTFIPQQPKE